MCWVQWDGNQVHFPAWSPEMISEDTEMLLSSLSPISVSPASSSDFLEQKSQFQHPEVKFPSQMPNPT